MMKFLLWCILLVLCWPLALLALVLYPIIWLLLLPFRLVGIAVDGALELRSRDYSISRSNSARAAHGLASSYSSSAADSCKLGNRIGVHTRLTQRISHGIPRKSSTQQAAIERRCLALIDSSPKTREFSPQPNANEIRFARLGEDSVERRFDVPVRHAALTQFARNAKSPLAACQPVNARELRGKSSVVEIFILLEPRENRFRVVGTLRPAFEQLAHFVH